MIVSICSNKHWPQWPAIVAKSKTYEKDRIMTKRRWLVATIEASKATDLILPIARSKKTRPAAFKHIQMHVAPRPKAIAAR